MSKSESSKEDISMQVVHPEVAAKPDESQQDNGEQAKDVSEQQDNGEQSQFETVIPAAAQASAPEQGYDLDTFAQTICSIVMNGHDEDALSHFLTQEAEFIQTTQQQIQQHGKNSVSGPVMAKYCHATYFAIQHHFSQR